MIRSQLFNLPTSTASQPANQQTMSKRPTSPSVQPLKLTKAAGDWTSAPNLSATAADVDLRSVEKAARPPFKPVPAGPKARIQQSYVLSYKPRLEATINLKGNQPEVRFASPDSSICITGDELLQLANCREDWPTKPIFLVDTRLEPLEDGCFRFARYSSEDLTEAQVMDIYPCTIFTMSKYAVLRLKTKLDVMSTHIFRICESESLINQMFDSIVQAYKDEYARLATMKPITAHFDELDRMVEAHVLPSSIVRHFCFNSSGSCWNHYSLLNSSLSQKTYLKSLLNYI